MFHYDAILLLWLNGVLVRMAQWSIEKNTPQRGNFLALYFTQCPEDMAEKPWAPLGSEVFSRLSSAHLQARPAWRCCRAAFGLE